MTVSGTTVRATIISMEPPGGAEKGKIPVLEYDSEIGKYREIW